MEFDLQKHFRDLKQHVVKVAHPRWLNHYLFPYFYFDKSSTDHNRKFAGADVWLLDYISRALNFRFQMQLTIDGQWGSDTGNGSWTGMVGMIMREVGRFSSMSRIGLMSLFQEVDIALGVITVTPERGKVVDFSWPYQMTSILSFFAHEPPPYPKSYGLVWPFTFNAWIGIVIAITVFIVTTWILFNIIQKNQHSGNETFLVVCIVLEQSKLTVF